MQRLVVIIFLFGSFQVCAQNPEQRLEELGITLPEVSAPAANYVKWTQVGNLLFLAGEGSASKGRVGKDLTVEEGYQAARETGIEILATIRDACGDLNKVKRIVKARGMVQSAADFYEQPLVINGFSDLMVEVFGEKGKHARAAVGHYNLPFNIALEIEVIVELEE